MAVKLLQMGHSATPRQARKPFTILPILIVANFRA
jgi:hypothetical protein